MGKVLFALLFFVPTGLTAQASFFSSVDEFTGEDHSIVGIPSLSTGGLSIGWGCASSDLNVMIGHGNQKLEGDSNGAVIVQTKFDDKDVSATKRYSLIPNREMTLFNDSDVKSFTDDAIKSNRMMIRVVDPHDRQTLTSSFSNDGLLDALEKLECYP